jgi:hypothetical protein
MPENEDVQRALFRIESTGEEVKVHFNPESLQYTITNNVSNTGSGNASKQYTSQSTGKLTMDLLFDTTGSGEDIRVYTSKIAKFMNPKEQNAPPIVIFEWGLYTFKGLVESFKETIDFFSANGVPLRASVNLSLSSQDEVFEGGARKAKTDGSFSLKPPAAFASGGFGISAGGGIGLGLSIGGGAGAGISAGVSVGGGMSAGVSASAGAFAGLRSGAVVSSSKTRLNVDPFIDEKVTANFGTDEQSSFSLGGQAGMQGSASLKADVGKPGGLKMRIEFDGD